MDTAIQAFQDWRSNRKKKCRIPERLWKIAAKLSPQYPISMICENLGLNWGTLRKKINHFSLSGHTPEPVQPVQSVHPHEPPSFIELKLNNQEQAPHSPSLLLNPSPSPSPYPPPSLSTCPSPSLRCAIELTKADGTVMKIFASNDADSPSNLNLLELFKTFLENSK